MTIIKCLYEEPMAYVCTIMWDKLKSNKNWIKVGGTYKFHIYKEARSRMIFKHLTEKDLFIEVL